MKDNNAYLEQYRNSWMKFRRDAKFPESTRRFVDCPHNHILAQDWSRPMLARVLEFTCRTCYSFIHPWRTFWLFETLVWIFRLWAQFHSSKIPTQGWQSLKTEINKSSLLHVNKKIIIAIFCLFSISFLLDEFRAEFILNCNQFYCTGYRSMTHQNDNLNIGFAEYTLCFHLI